MPRQTDESKQAFRDFEAKGQTIRTRENNKVKSVCMGAAKTYAFCGVLRGSTSIAFKGLPAVLKVAPVHELPAWRFRLLILTSTSAKQSAANSIK